MKYLLLIFIGVFSVSANSDCAENSCTNIKITRLYVQADGNTIVRTSGDESKLNCDAGSNGYITLDYSSKNYKEIYSLLLMAHATEKLVWIRASGSGACKINYIVSDL